MAEALWRRQGLKAPRVLPRVIRLPVHVIESLNKLEKERKALRADGRLPPRDGSTNLRNQFIGFVRQGVDGSQNVGLGTGKQFHSHLGVMEHDDLIGRPEGSVVAIGNRKLLAFRPTLADYGLKMKRGAQVVYPKDIGLILVYADIFPGATVVEAVLYGMARGDVINNSLKSVDLKDDKGCPCPRCPWRPCCPYCPSFSSPPPPKPSKSTS